MWSKKRNIFSKTCPQCLNNLILFSDLMFLQLTLIIVGLSSLLSLEIAACSFLIKRIKKKVRPHKELFFNCLCLISILLKKLFNLWILKFITDVRKSWKARRVSSWCVLNLTCLNYLCLITSLILTLFALKIQLFLMSYLQEWLINRWWTQHFTITWMVNAMATGSSNKICISNFKGKR